MAATLLEIARKELGIHETPGPQATARIVEYDSTTTLKATSDEVPWCSSFVNWVVTQAGGRGTNSAAAVSWLDWGIPIPKKLAQPGDIVVFHWSSGGHHVAFFIKDLGDYVKVLGGNQSDQVKYALEPKNRIMGVRRWAA